MISVFVDVLVPVFAIVGVGFFVALRFDVEPRALTTLAYWVLGPAFVFDVLANADIDVSVVTGVVVVTAVTMVTTGLLAAAVMRLLGRSFSELAATVLTSVYGNVGNFGLAISAFALGEEILPIAGIVLVTVNTLGILTGVGLANIRHHSPARSLLTAVFSPLAVAVVPAIVVNTSATELPLWVGRPVSLVAAAMIPVMLLTLGVQIARMPKKLPSGRIAIPIGLKLIIAPLVAVSFARVFGLTEPASSVVILQSAMPAAVFTALIGLEHDLESDYITSVVLVGTLVSALTLPLVLITL